MSGEEAEAIVNWPRPSIPMKFILEFLPDAAGVELHVERQFELARAEFLFVDVRLSNPAMHRWYFGDWGYRLNPVNWAKGGWTGLNSLFGSFALAGFFLWGLCVVKARLGWILLAGNVVAALVFSHLVLAHQHYYLMFAPAVAVLGAARSARGSASTRPSPSKDIGTAHGFPDHFMARN